MLDQRNLHVYLNWARERIDKTDATLASFETKASEAKADLKPKFGDLVYFESCVRRKSAHKHLCSERPAYHSAALSICG